MTKILEVNHLSIQQAGNQIIEDLSFVINEGEFVSITGPSGSGKSTLLKYLAQLNNPKLQISGDYQFLGKEINEYRPVELRQQITYFFQTPSLFGDTVRDNLAFPFEIRNLPFDESKAQTMLENVELARNFLDKPINSLSGGEKQRVALIRNFMFPSKVILLDEITSALDLNTRNTIWNWIAKYRESHRVTILMVSHMEEEHEMSDRKIDIPKLEEGSAENGE